MQTGKTVALINHQPIMLEGLLRIFAGNDSLVLLELGLPTSETVDMIVRRHPDLIVLDSEGPDRGIDKIAVIARQSPQTKVMVFTSAISIDHAVRALDAGAVGYVSSTSTAEELLHAVKAVLSGETFISQNIATKVISALRTAAAARETAAPAKALNVREEQIASLLLKGQTNREMARNLGLSEKTIKHYMTILMQKLRARNRLELVLAIRPTASATGNPLFN
ncbi:DNA-binding response regulator [Mesorhizobium albiziae]|nr:DNA-binding response regulator [Mesorhizobium albiziae]